MTIAGEILAKMGLARTKAEQGRVLDEMYARKVAKRGSPAHGWLIFADFSAIEITESENEDDDLVTMREAVAIPVSKN